MDARTHCRHGHRLDAPNLVASQLRKGSRTCRACDIAGKYARRKGLSPAERLEHAHARYAAIMEEATPEPPAEATEQATAPQTPEPEQDAAEAPPRCKRGHELTGSNLDAANLRRGRLHCRACHAAAVLRRRRARRGITLTETDLRTYADTRYRAILDGEPEHPATA